MQHLLKKKRLDSETQSLSIITCDPLEVRVGGYICPLPLFLIIVLFRMLNQLQVPWIKLTAFMLLVSAVL